MAAPRTANRLLWFIGLWLGGVLTVAVLGYAIKLILKG